MASKDEILSKLKELEEAITQKDFEVKRRKKGKWRIKGSVAKNRLGEQPFTATVERID